jgi:hypothetical protein
LNTRQATAVSISYFVEQLEATLSDTGPFSPFFLVQQAHLQSERHLSIQVCREGVFRGKDGGSVVLALTQLPSQTSICAGGVSSKLHPPCPEFA